MDARLEATVKRLIREHRPLLEKLARYDRGLVCDCGQDYAYVDESYHFCEKCDTQ